jgi:NADH pyrophosphatase NudC (nudix superfamily)
MILNYENLRILNLRGKKMIRCERCGNELGLGDKVRVCKKCGAEHTFKDGNWEMTCKGGEICSTDE